MNRFLMLLREPCHIIFGVIPDLESIANRENANLAVQESHRCKIPLHSPFISMFVILHRCIHGKEDIHINMTFEDA